MVRMHYTTKRLISESAGVISPCGKWARTISPLFFRPDRHALDMAVPTTWLNGNTVVDQVDSIFIVFLCYKSWT